MIAGFKSSALNSGNGYKRTVPLSPFTSSIIKMLLSRYDDLESGETFTLRSSGGHGSDSITMDDGFHDEKMLAKKAAAGDIKAFGMLVEVFQKPVFGFLYRILRSVEDTEDVAQETFLRAWKYMERYDSRWRFNTWLFSIARNAALNLLKKKGRRNISLHDRWDESPGVVGNTPDNKGPDAFQALQSKELGNALMNAVAKLPEKSASIFHLRHKEHMKIRDIARTMDLTESDVKVTLYRCRAFLKSELREWLK